jgi:uncharacterized delta-60 repeat protein
MKPNLRHTLAGLIACSTFGSAHAAFGDPDPTFAPAPFAPPTYCDRGIGATGDATMYMGVRGLGVRGESNGVTKLRKDGSVDTAWGQDGSATMPGIPEHGGGSMSPTGFLATPDGGVIVVGIRLVRLTRAGLRDAAYGVDGVSDPIEQPSFIHSFALQPDGSVVVFATGHNGGPAGAFTRITPSGRRDASFGNGGVVSIDSTNREVYSWSVSGQHVEYATHPPYAVGAPSLQLHAASPSSGRIVANYGAAAWTSPNVQVQPDGRMILAAATCDSSSCKTPTVSVIGYNSDGSLDMEFGEQGMRSVTPFTAAQLYSPGVYPRMLSLGQEARPP